MTLVDLSLSLSPNTSFSLPPPIMRLSFIFVGLHAVINKRQLHKSGWLVNSNSHCLSSSLSRLVSLNLLFLSKTTVLDWIFLQSLCEVYQEREREAHTFLLYLHHNDNLEKILDVYHKIHEINESDFYYTAEEIIAQEFDLQKYYLLLIITFVFLP